MKKNNSVQREKIIRFNSLALSAVATVIKLTAGAVSASVFIVISGFYSCGTGIAKALCFKGRNETDKGRCAKFYLAIAGVLTVSALLYIAGAVRQFFVPAFFGFGLIPAIAVAAVAFYDLGAAIYGLVKAAHAKNGFRVALKWINLSSAFAAIALTQVAILSVNSDGGDPIANAAMGLVAGAVMAGCALATAVKGFKELPRESDVEQKTDKENFHHGI